MSVKYRIRLENDRVIGPFVEDEIIELFEKEHIKGTEMCQIFPIGEWKSIETYEQINNRLNSIKEVWRKNEEERYRLQLIADEEKRKEEEIERITREQARKQALLANSNNEEVGVEKTIIRGSSNNKTHSGLKVFNEFKFEQGAKVEIDYKELDKKYKKEEPVKNDDGLDRTRIISRRKSKEIDKTVVFRKIDKDELMDPTLVEKKPEMTEVEKKSQLVKFTPHNNNKDLKELVNEQTQFLDIQEVLPKINAQLRASEIELDRLAKIQENEEKFREKEEKERLAKEEKEREILDIARRARGEETSGKKKGMSWIVALAFIAIIYTLLDTDEAPVKKGPAYLKVAFPITKEFEDVQKAKDALIQGRALYAENTYEKRAMSVLYYLTSAEFQFDGNPAIGEMLLTYTELLENARDEKQASNVVYKLIKVSEKNLLKDPNTATAAAMFYGKIGKPNTGINVIKNFLRVGSKPHIKMLSIYLELLISSGDLVEARKAFEKIQAIPKKPFEVYISLARFLEADEKLAEAQTIIEEGLKYYPKNVALLLKIADYSTRSQAIEILEEATKKIAAVEVEGSPVYLAQYFKYMGYLNAYKGKNKNAASFFKKSLDIKENEELRMRLADLEISGNQLSQNLILESKIMALVKRAKEELKNKNWDQAVSLISEAVEANSNYIPAAILQSEIQISRGLFEAAINTLVNIKENNPNNMQILSLLIEAYLKAFKFDDAQRLLVEGSQSKYSNSSDYYYLYGLYFEGKGNLVFAIKYFEESLKRNPLNDKIMFKLASIYFNSKKLPLAKKWLSDAMTLDPKNTEYLSLYAQILQEQDNADVAIGYLRDVISDIGEDPKLLSTITAIYFKTGQLNEFKMYYKKIQQLPKKDESFYEYLASAALLDNSYEEFEQYSKEIIKINPGNLRARMNLAEHYIIRGKLQDAVNELTEIKEKLPSYPRVNHLLARVYLAQGDLVEAKKMAQLELKMNPNLDSAFYIVGEVYRQAREYREAVSNFEKAVSKNGKSVEALMGLAWIRLNQNLASEALDLYTRAVKIEPNNAEIHRQLGMTYKSLGQRAMAKEKLEDYLKLNPAAPDKSQIDSIIKTLK
jgi:tetratricopeptide (TPR) repeat protein